jgi:hypothetical protein
VIKEMDDFAMGKKARNDSIFKDHGSSEHSDENISNQLISAEQRKFIKALDEKDVEIITTKNKNKRFTIEEIAEAVHLGKDAVNTRLRKYRELSNTATSQEAIDYINSLALFPN